VYRVMHLLIKYTLRGNELVFQCEKKQRWNSDRSYDRPRPVSENNTRKSGKVHLWSELDAKPEGKRSLGRRRRRYECNIRMDLG
jgi:hypothetical protein